MTRDEKAAKLIHEYAIDYARRDYEVGVYSGVSIAEIMETDTPEKIVEKLKGLKDDE